MAVESFGQRNIFRPSSAVTDPAGWSAAPAFGNAVGGAVSAIANASNRLLTQSPADLLGIDSAVASLTNPPFTSGAAGRINTMIHNGTAGKIQRGYIRRAAVSPSDTLSKSRLYFMYNPPQIQRQYISYLDQAALDPYNTIYGSANQVAAPGFLDFSFELFFDRQDEAAMNADHRGVYVDFEVFDMVVRNVPPNSQTGAGSSVQDNGVMLVNPRDLTVVFSKDLTVQGRAYNASVTFEKFTNRMTPIRMRIGITMKVLYIGPERPETEQVDFNKEKNYRVTVPYNSKLGLPTTSTDVQEFRDQLENSIRSGIERLTALTAGIGVSGALDLSRSVLSDRQILLIVQSVGVPQDQWANAIAICLAESGGQVSVIGGPNTDGSYDRGLWQINDIHASYDKTQLVTYPMYNARAMYTISSGGTVWTPWSAYNNGSYARFLQRANDAIAAGPENLYNGGDNPINMLAAQEAANAPGNTDAVGRVLAFAKRFSGLPYVYGGSSLVTGCDCSGFVWACFREQGLLTAMNWDGRQYVASMMQGWVNRGWDTAILLMTWDPSEAKDSVRQRLFDVVRPGDLMVRWGTARSDHIGFFSHWAGNSPVIFDCAEPPGYVSESNWDTYYANWAAHPGANYVVRPRPIGALNASRGGVPG